MEFGLFSGRLFFLGIGCGVPVSSGMSALDRSIDQCSTKAWCGLRCRLLSRTPAPSSGALLDEATHNVFLLL